MTFREKFQSSSEWHERASIMSTYHYAMKIMETRWTIRKTAKYFRVSIGLTSENLRLANAVLDNGDLIRVKTRQAALDRLNGR